MQGIWLGFSPSPLLVLARSLSLSRSQINLKKSSKELGASAGFERYHAGPYALAGRVMGLRADLRVFLSPAFRGAGEEAPGL